MARENVISAKNLVCSYGLAGRSPVLNKLSFTVKSGAFFAVLGGSGSGKSTLTRLLSGLLPLQEGELMVLGLDMAGRTSIRAVRRRIGLVFSPADRCFAAGTVGDELAFGLKNFGTPRCEIKAKVELALERSGLRGYERLPISLLSEDEKRRMAIACALAREPELLIIDDGLPAGGSRETARLIELLRGEGRSLVLLSTQSDLAADADRVLLLNNGRKATQGTARKILCDTEKLSEAGLAPPLAVRLYNDLKKAGAELPTCPISLEELGDIVCQYR